MKPEPSSPAPSTRLLKCLRALLAVSGGMIVSLGTAKATVTPPLPEGAGSLEDRVQKIQDQLQQNSEGIQNGSATEDAPKTMWWNNWHNWPNWHNWHNAGWNNWGNGGWHNWGNGGWHNWGNWHNF